MEDVDPVVAVIAADVADHHVSVKAAAGDTTCPVDFNLAQEVADALVSGGK